MYGDVSCLRCNVLSLLLFLALNAFVQLVFVARYQQASTALDVAVVTHAILCVRARALIFINLISGSLGAHLADLQLSLMYVLYLNMVSVIGLAYMYELILT